MVLAMRGVFTSERFLNVRNEDVGVTIVWVELCATHSKGTVEKLGFMLR
jgi:hypothetical protein